MVTRSSLDGSRKAPGRPGYAKASMPHCRILRNSSPPGHPPLQSRGQSQKRCVRIRHLTLGHRYNTFLSNAIESHVLQARSGPGYTMPDGSVASPPSEPLPTPVLPRAGVPRDFPGVGDTYHSIRYETLT